MKTNVKFVKRCHDLYDLSQPIKSVSLCRRKSAERPKMMPALILAFLN